jgi:hypothetical protein
MSAEYPVIRSLPSMNAKEIRAFICSYLGIRFRRNYEIAKALEWFIVFTSYILVMSIVQQQLQILFTIAYQSGHFTFSIWLTKGLFELMNGGLVFLLAYAFGYLAMGTFRMKEEEL